MTIGINATAAIKQSRTGVEEYTYQLIKHLTMLKEASEHRFLLYLPATGGNPNKFFDFHLPENFVIRKLKWSLPMWTQIRLASEMFFDKPEALFIPVHILPRFHPRNSTAVIHGLEYEYFPEYYPFWFRHYLRWSTKYALRNARKIIAVSQSTKNDLIKVYGAEPEKIKVVYHGIEFQSSKFKVQNANPRLKIKKPYIFYVGRIELKKNILGILEAYKILKEKYNIPHELMLAGAPGFGFKEIKLKIKNLSEIKELGYITENEKRGLLENADLFIFPSFYEGFGLPILEAQSYGVPIVSSNVSSLPEIAGEGALLINPKNPEEIAQAVYKIIDDKELRDKLIKLGKENLIKFDWHKCAKETLEILIDDL